MTDAFICDAIRKRLLLEFRYRGLPRVVEPYCHGISARGVEVQPPQERLQRVRGGVER